MRRWVLPLLLAGAIVSAFLLNWAIAGQTAHSRVGKLNAAQHVFLTAFAQLIWFAQDMGYTVSIGECQRFGGPKNSLHRLRLACDIHLFKDGHYLRATESYRHLGAWWMRYGRNYDIPLEWGGYNGRGDGNHFSHGWNGRW